MIVAQIINNIKHGFREQQYISREKRINKLTKEVMEGLKIAAQKKELEELQARKDKLSPGPLIKLKGLGDHIKKNLERNEQRYFNKAIPDNFADYTKETMENPKI
jgi:hypothetical protein